MDMHAVVLLSRHVVAIAAGVRFVLAFNSPGAIPPAPTSRARRVYMHMRGGCIRMRSPGCIPYNAAIPNSNRGPHQPAAKAAAVERA